MSTYANVKMGEIFAIYGNPFSRKNWKKNIIQSLFIRYYKRINFSDIIFIEKKSFFYNNFYPNLHTSSFIMNSSKSQIVPMRMDVNEGLRHKNLLKNLQYMKINSFTNNTKNKKEITIKPKQLNNINSNANIYCESRCSLTNIPEEKFDLTEVRGLENNMKNRITLKKKALSYRTTIKNGT